MLREDPGNEVEFYFEPIVPDVFFFWLFSFYTFAIF